MQYKLQKCDVNGVVADGRRVSIENFLFGELFVNNVCMHVKLCVVDTHIESILGMDLVPELGLKIGRDDGLVFSLVPDSVRNFKHLFNKSLKDSVLQGIEPFKLSA